MPMDKRLRRKIEMQYISAEQQHRLLIQQLYDLIDDLENRPVVRSPNLISFDFLERMIQKGLNWVERKWLRGVWAKLQSRASR